MAHEVRYSHHRRVPPWHTESARLQPRTQPGGFHTRAERRGYYRPSRSRVTDLIFSSVSAREGGRTYLEAHVYLPASKELSVTRRASGKSGVVSVVETFTTVASSTVRRIRPLFFLAKSSSLRIPRQSGGETYARP
jgi:hypothetical protein